MPVSLIPVDFDPFAPERFGDFRRSDNVEDRRKRRVDPEISTGSFSAGMPIPNVFDGNGGLMTGLRPEDFAQTGPTPLGRALGYDDIKAPVLLPVDHDPFAEPAQ